MGKLLSFFLVIMRNKPFLIASFILMIILMYFSTQWFINMPRSYGMLGMLAVIVSTQMIFGIMAKLTGFSVMGKKSDGTTFNVFTEESYIVSIVSVSFGLVLYVIIGLLLSFVLEQENPILTFALTFLIVLGGYLELKRRAKLDFN